MKSVELTMNIYSKMMFKKKKNQITTHLKLMKFLKTFSFFFFFFATWPPLGKTAIPFSLEGLHKGSKIGECSKALSLGVSITCCFMTVSCQSPHLDSISETMKREGVKTPMLTVVTATQHKQAFVKGTPNHGSHTGECLPKSCGPPPHLF